MENEGVVFDHDNAAPNASFSILNWENSYNKVILTPQII